MLSADPSQPSVKLAHSIATSQTADEDAWRQRIVSRAKLIGADAVVPGKVEVLESFRAGARVRIAVEPGRCWNQLICMGILGMADPSSLDPWSSVQGTADQRAWTMYLSVLPFDTSSRCGEMIATMTSLTVAGKPSM